ncbi:MAG: hypothetical protein JO189_32965 [Deltaproteobacteria bacterium]|nr:hypothetical protein [Deltaproteobacteria bacterium]
MLVVVENVDVGGIARRVSVQGRGTGNITLRVTLRRQQAQNIDLDLVRDMAARLLNAFRKPPGIAVALDAQRPRYHKRVIGGWMSSIFLFQSACVPYSAKAWR